MHTNEAQWPGRLAPAPSTMKHRQTGFTLVELMITVALLGILLAAAAPNFDSALNSSRLAGVANELTGAVNVARAEAIRRNQRVALCRSADGASCSADGNWSGWMVFVDADSNCARADTEEVLKTGSVDAPVVVRESAAISALSGCIAFRPDGIARGTDGAALLAGSLAACIPTTRPAENVRAVAIAFGGRTTLRRQNGGGACDVPSDS